MYPMKRGKTSSPWVLTCDRVPEVTQMTHGATPQGSPDWRIVLVQQELAPLPTDQQPEPPHCPQLGPDKLTDNCEAWDIRLARVGKNDSSNRRTSWSTRIPHTVAATPLPRLLLYQCVEETMDATLGLNTNEVNVRWRWRRRLSGQQDVATQGVLLLSP